jgi:hypothetical protein
MSDLTIIELADTPEIVVQVIEEEPFTITVEGGAGPIGPPGPIGLDGGVLVNLHRVAAQPHPAYDDANDFALLFENALL